MFTWTYCPYVSSLIQLGCIEVVISYSCLYNWCYSNDVIYCIGLNNCDNGNAVTSQAIFVVYSVALFFVSVIQRSLR